MTDKKLPPKVYVRGTIGKTQELMKILADHGVKNPMEYRFGDPDAIYYVDKRGEIQIASPDSDLYYVITNSDWIELKPSKTKKFRKYILTIKEGSPSCDGCEYGQRCDPKQRDKCELGKLLTKVTNGPQMAGKTIQIEDLTDVKEPPSPITHQDL